GKELKIAASDYTPEIYFSEEKNLFSIKGKSIPENASEFYNQVLEAFNDYIRNHKEYKDFTANFNVMYFNTSSAKFFHKIFDRIKFLKDHGASVTVNWYYEHDDEDIKEAGLDYQELTELKFNLIPLQ
ncbi:MAG: DUF1987 domain-containing protein, partial [Bacteroidetes bacterium]